ncbi:G1 family glutamic endopeptidase [Paenibacillus senegalensis]|uniref:G1 family glutamic endopeptidase n=1 Tax=Paenibacillus senegalensis TaxID=1465766 RepID=UPI0012F90546|nr:G1 family glutamic endopeptidase [Paenibacillus senegalensis]
MVGKLTRKKWKGSAPVQAASSSQTPPRSAASVEQSDNWSGYVITSWKKNAVRSISGHWVVPRIRRSRTNTYSSAWLGIDGYRNSSLIQTGTGQDFVNGKPVYYPWWEILPAPETKINYPVSPKDHMYARISRISGSKWRIVLINKTKGWTFKKTVPYTGPATSAEWIIEAPSLNGQTTQLANYGKTAFRKSRVNGKNPLLKPSNRFIMVQNNQVVSTPSLPNKKRDGFTVAYGSRLPKPQMRTRKK